MLNELETGYCEGRKFDDFREWGKILSVKRR